MARRVDPSDPNTVPKFVHPVPVPAVLPPVCTKRGVKVYQITMRQVEQKLHRDFPPTPVWGYAGSYPGPTIEVTSFCPVQVKYANELPETHLLPVDDTIAGAEPFRPPVRTVVHLHGANVPPESDGHPDAWFSPGNAVTGPLFRSDRFDYPNRQPATALWYHDHAIGITRLNVYAGLAGFYLIRDAFEASLNLPAGRYEIPLLIQDRTFRPDAALFYPPSITPEFFGNTILVNGKVWPFLVVEPRRYRFRLLNGSNARFYNLTLDPPLPFLQIGVDGGFLAQPVWPKSILLAPAERADVIVDFTGKENMTFTLINDAPAPFPGGEPPDANTRLVLQFQVTEPLHGSDTSSLPFCLPPSDAVPWESSLPTRDLTLNEEQDAQGRVLPLLGIRGTGGRPLPLTWGDSTTEFPALHTWEIWRLINVTGDTHPIHLHLVRFHLLDRQPFDVDLFKSTGRLVFTGPPVPPDENERGPKDTVRANPGQVTRLAAWFGDFAGPFVWHCHILEHEDHGMMRQYEVVPRPCR